MRAFVQTLDYEILPATDVYETDEAIYFRLNDIRFKHDKKDSYRTLTPFQQFANGMWLYTMRINYLHILDETEDEELNYFESTDFNAGVIYCRMEKSVVKHLIKEELDEVTIAFDLPKIQMFLNTEGFNEHRVMATTLDTVKNHFEAVYGKSFTISELNWYKNKQYVSIHYKISRKVQPKEMTIQEIEEALGYKIKVVGDKQ